MPFSLPALLAVGGVLASLSSQAQSIAAGATTGVGVRYTDLNPDKVLTAALPSGSNVTVQSRDSLDLDADGRFDVRFTALANRWSMAGRGGNYAAARVALLHPDVEMVAVAGTPALTAFAAQEVIQSTVLPNPVSMLPNAWLDRTALLPNAALLHGENNPAGSLSYGYWTPGSERFLAVRVRTAAASPWAYGWIRLKVSNFNTSSVTLTVLDYALEQAVLGTRSATARTWQAYPNPAADVLQLRGAPGGSQARILDAQGRVCLTRHATAASPLALDVALLPAGMYVLQVISGQGITTQRFVKR